MENSGASMEPQPSPPDGEVGNLPDLITGMMSDPDELRRLAGEARILAEGLLQNHTGLVEPTEDDLSLLELEMDLQDAAPSGSPSDKMLLYISRIKNPKKVFIIADLLDFFAAARLAAEEIVVGDLDRQFGENL